MKRLLIALSAGFLGFFTPPPVWGAEWTPEQQVQVLIGYAQRDELTDIISQLVTGARYGNDICSGVYEIYKALRPYGANFKDGYVDWEGVLYTFFPELFEEGYITLEKAAEFCVYDLGLNISRVDPNYPGVPPHPPVSACPYESGIQCDWFEASKACMALMMEFTDHYGMAFSGPMRDIANGLIEALQTGLWSSNFAGFCDAEFWNWLDYTYDENIVCNVFQYQGCERATNIMHTQARYYAQNGTFANTQTLQDIICDLNNPDFATLFGNDMNKCNGHVSTINRVYGPIWYDAGLLARYVDVFNNLRNTGDYNTAQQLLVNIFQSAWDTSDAAAGICPYSCVPMVCPTDMWGAYSCQACPDGNTDELPKTFVDECRYDTAIVTGSDASGQYQSGQTNCQYQLRLS